MRILITITGPWGTGSFQVAKDVARNLINQGHQVKLFFPDNHQPSGDLEEYYGHTDLYDIWEFPISNEETTLEGFPLLIPDPNPRNPNGKTFKQLTPGERSLYFNQLEEKLKRVISDFKPDVIECQHIWSMPYAVSKLGYPFVVVAIHCVQMAYKYDETMSDVADHAAEAAQCIFVVSDYVKQGVIDCYEGLDASKIRIIPPSYDDSVHMPMQLDRDDVLKHFDLTLPTDAKLIAFTGKLSKTKGVDTVLLSQQYLSDNIDTHFLVMGAGNIDGVLTPAEKEDIDFSRIHFIGHHQPSVVAKVNNIADLNIVASREEAFCLAGLEAQACGTPAVTTRCGGPEEYAIGGMVDVNNPKQMAEAMEAVLTLPADEYQALSQKGMKVAERYRGDALVQQRMECYRSASISR